MMRASTPSFEPSKEEEAQKREAKRDKFMAILDEVRTDTRTFQNVYGSRGVLSGSPLGSMMR